MKQIITNDTSISYYNEEFGEAYHSTSGAIEESFEKFARPCELKEGMRILDVCFGLGYNSLAALCLANVHIVALENDPDILKEINDNQIFIGDEKNKKYDAQLIKEKYEIIKTAAFKKEYLGKKISLKIVMGDARETIREVTGEFDAVFLDPFSPKKCPELWSREFLAEIYGRMKIPSVLTTYSCASAFRKNLLALGFQVEDGPCVGRRSPATLARKMQ